MEETHLESEFEEEENALLRSPVSSPTVSDAERAASELVPSETHQGGTSEQEWEDIASTTGSDPSHYLESTIEGSECAPPPPLEVNVVVKQPGTSPGAESQRPPEEESREETDDDSAPERGSESPPLI